MGTAHDFPYFLEIDGIKKIKQIFTVKPKSVNAAFFSREKKSIGFVVKFYYCQWMPALPADCIHITIIEMGLQTTNTAFYK